MELASWTCLESLLVSTRHLWAFPETRLITPFVRSKGAPTELWLVGSRLGHRWTGDRSGKQHYNLTNLVQITYFLLNLPLIACEVFPSDGFRFLAFHFLVWLTPPTSFIDARPPIISAFLPLTEAKATSTQFPAVFTPTPQLQRLIEWIRQCPFRPFSFFSSSSVSELILNPPLKQLQTGFRLPSPKILF